MEGEETMGAQCHYCKRELPEPGVNVVVEYIDALTGDPVPSCQDCRIERDLAFHRVRETEGKKKKR
jgi:hypothetical protein